MTRTTRLVQVIGAIAVLVGVTMLPSLPFADAASVDDAGWWDRNNGVPLGGVAPPAEGVLRVANDPTGPSAVAAIRIALEPGESRPVLVLRVTGPTAPAGAGFLACRPKKAWKGDSGGPWGERPLADCEKGRAPGVVAEDGTTVTFGLASLVAGGVVDVVIGPAPTAGNPIGDTFTTDFAAPTGDDVTTVGAAPTTAPPTTSAPPETPAPSNDALAPPAPSFDSSGPSSGPAPAPDVPFDVPAADDAAAPDDGGVDTAAPPLTPATPETAASSDGDDRGGRRATGAGIAFAIIGIGAYLWLSERNKVPQTGPVLGGLGAFQRPRDAPAPDIA